MNVVSPLHPCIASILLVVANCGPSPALHVEVRNDSSESIRFMAGFAYEGEGGERHHDTFFEGQLVAGHSSATSVGKKPPLTGSEMTFNAAVFHEADPMLLEPIVLLSPIIEQAPQSGTYQFVYAYDLAASTFRISHGWKPESP